MFQVVISKIFHNRTSCIFVQSVFINITFMITCRKAQITTLLWCDYPKIPDWTSDTLHIHTVVAHYRLLYGLQTIRPVMMRRLHCCKTLNTTQDYAEHSHCLTTVTYRPISWQDALTALFSSDITSRIAMEQSHLLWNWNWWKSPTLCCKPLISVLPSNPEYLDTFIHNPYTYSDGKGRLRIFYPNNFTMMNVGPCHHGMARPRVADRGTASNMEGSCE